jgi:hypothetical protein
LWDIFWFTKERFGCFIYNVPSMDDFILAFDDDDNNDDDDVKDGEVQLHVDVGGCSQFPDENIPKTF